MASLTSTKCVTGLRNHPQLIEKRPENPAKETDCAVYGPEASSVRIFFQNTDWAVDSVNWERYRALLADCFLAGIGDNGSEQNVVSIEWCHSHTQCNNRITGLIREIVRTRRHWPSRSSDLSPKDYFLWDYLKSLVYANKPDTTDDL